MRFLICLLVVCVVMGTGIAKPLFRVVDPYLNDSWENFKQFYNKVYDSPATEIKRRLIWETNYHYINKHNDETKLGIHTFSLAMNEFGDLKNSEFVEIYTGFKNDSNRISEFIYRKPQRFQYPKSVDWRIQGYVTPIKNQGQCGSSWAFAAIASLEGQIFKYSRNLVRLSEQNLIDCSRKYGNQGCNGGSMDQAYDYIRVFGIDTEATYPYMGVDQQCKYNPLVGANIVAREDISVNDEESLTAAIAQIGPISAAIDASLPSFQFYSRGVYSELRCSSKSLNHGTTIVGYGTQGGEDYYVLKNMWGTSWGNRGYMYMARDKNNMCGIASMASYPLI